MLLRKFALPTLCVLAILAGCGRNDPAAELDDGDWKLARMNWQ